MPEPTPASPIRGSSRCRRSSGGASVALRAPDLRFAGAGRVARHQPPPPYTLVRCCCREPETSLRDFPIAIGALDEDPLVRLALHGHVAESAPWEALADDLPKFPGRPPGFGGGPSQ